MEASSKVALDNEKPKTSLRSSHIKQFIISMAAAMGCIPAGIIQLWPNILATDLAESNLSIFSTRINLEPWQMDMVGSVVQIGSLFGFISSGYLVSRVGRKWSLAISTIPGIFGSASITLAINSYMIIFGRFLDGLSNGMINVAVMTYIVETADNSIRGSVCMLLNVGFQIGGILTLSVGLYTRWYFVSCFCGGILIVWLLIVLCTLNETPSFLAVQGRDKEAVKVLESLRGYLSPTDINEEIDYLKKENSNSDKSHSYSVLLDRQYLKTIAIVSGVFLVHNLSGVQILRVNATRQLQEFGLAIDEEISALMITSLYFFGNMTMLYSVDRIGRRSCIIISLVILSVMYTVLATFVFIAEPGSKVDIFLLNDTNIQLNSTSIEVEETSSIITVIMDWLPLACLMIIGFGQCVGIGPVVWILSSEMFPTKIRSQANGVCTMIGGLQMFTVLQGYSLMRSTLTLAGMYWMFALTAFLGLFYIYFVLKETGGRRVG